jgi:hypothetical protein
MSELTTTPPEQGTMLAGLVWNALGHKIVELVDGATAMRIRAVSKSLRDLIDTCFVDIRITDRPYIHLVVRANRTVGDYFNFLNFETPYFANLRAKEEVDGRVEQWLNELKEEVDEGEDHVEFRLEATKAREAAVDSKLHTTVSRQMRSQLSLSTIVQLVLDAKLLEIVVNAVDVALPSVTRLVVPLSPIGIEYEPGCYTGVEDESQWESKSEETWGAISKEAFEPTFPSLSTLKLFSVQFKAELGPLHSKVKELVVQKHRFKLQPDTGVYFERWNEDFVKILDEVRVLNHHSFPQLKILHASQFCISSFDFNTQAAVVREPGLSLRSDIASVIIEGNNWNRCTVTPNRWTPLDVFNTHMSLAGDARIRFEPFKHSLGTMSTL